MRIVKAATVALSCVALSCAVALTPGCAATDVGLSSTGEDVVGSAEAAPDALGPDVVGPVAAAVVAGRPTVVTAGLDEAARLTPSPPVALSIAALALSMAVDPVGLAPDGTMALPGSARTAGWFQQGPVPADGEGNVVIAAHVDDAEVGLGPFAGLRDLTVGDEIHVSDARGRHFGYRVTRVDQTHKAEVDPDTLFVGDLSPRLVLVTCGGRWDASVRHYQDNVIVWAEPMESPS